MAGIPFNNLSSNITNDSDLSFGSGESHVLMAVAIPYVDPTPENEEISSSNTTTTNVHFIKIARENMKGVAFAIMIAMIIMIIIYVIIFKTFPGMDVFTL